MSRTRRRPRRRSDSLEKRDVSAPIGEISAWVLVYGIFAAGGLVLLQAVDAKPEEHVRGLTFGTPAFVIVAVLRSRNRAKTQ